MGKKFCSYVTAVAILASSVAAFGAVTFVGNLYETGAWTGSIDTETYTGNGPNSKVWEYENILFPNAWNTETPFLDPNDPNGAEAAFFTYKYTANRYFNKMWQRYVDGYMQDATPGVEVYIDISTDNINWTRVWSLENDPSVEWITYFGYWPPPDPIPPATNPYRWIEDEGKTFTFPATKTLYVKHGTNFCRHACWQMLGSGAYSGVILYRVDGIPPQSCDEVKAMDFVIAEDLNGDCRVNFSDIAIQVANWLNCIVPGEAGCDTPWVP